MGEQTALLRVLKGSYKGSEMPLELEHAFVLGSSIECDITIDDESLSDRQLTFVVKEDGVDITILDGEKEIYKDGIRIQQDQFPLPFFEALHVGEFCFAIGPSGLDWPDINLSIKNDDHKDQNKPSEENSVSEEADEFETDEFEINETKQTQNLTEPGNDSLDTKGAQEEIDESEKQKTHKKGTKKKALRILSLVAFILIGLVIAGFYYLDSLVSQNNETNSKEILSQSEMIEGILLENDWKDLRLVKNKQDDTETTLKIIGYLDTQRQKEELLFALNGKRISCELDIFINEQMLSAGHSLLNAFSFRGVELSIGRRAGTLVAKGYIENLDRWHKIKALLERDVEGLRLLVDEVDTAARRLDKLKDTVEKIGLKNEVSLFLSNEGFIVARTALDPDNEHKWTVVEEAYKKSFGDQPKLIRLVDKPNWINIKSINLGNEPYIMLADGTKYIEGSMLKNGLIVEKINEYGVELKGKHGIRIVPIRLRE